MKQKLNKTAVFISQFRSLLLFLFYSFQFILISGCENSSNKIFTTGSKYIPTDTADLNFVQGIVANARATQNEDSITYWYQQVAQYGAEKGNDRLRSNAYGWIAERYHSFRNYAMRDLFLDSIAWVIKQCNDSDKLKELQIYQNTILAKTTYSESDSAAEFLKAALKDSIYISDKHVFQIYGALAHAMYKKKLYTPAKEYTLALLKNINDNVPIPSERLYNKAVLYSWLYTCYRGLADTSMSDEYLYILRTLESDSFTNNFPPEIYLTFTEHYIEGNRLDSANFFLEKYLVKTNNNTDPATEVHHLLLQTKLNLLFNSFSAANNSINQIKIPDSGFADQQMEKEYYALKSIISEKNGDFKNSLLLLKKKNSIDSLLNKAEKGANIEQLEKDLTELRAETVILQKDRDLKQQKIYNIILIAGCFAIAGFGILLYYGQRRKKIIEQQKRQMLLQQTALEKQELVTKVEHDERRRIAQEIHDDIGSTVTSISMAANIIKSNPEHNVHDVSVGIISKNAQQLNAKMRAIIWSLNSESDTLENLVGFIKISTQEFLNDAGIKSDITSSILDNDTIIIGYKRRILFHVIREAVNNAVKHSEASLISLKFIQVAKILNIEISDNGKGMEENATMGNGINNIKKQIAQLEGQVEWHSSNKGTSIKIEVSVDKLAT